MLALLSMLLLVLAVLGGILVMQWGAGRASSFFDDCCSRWGVPPTAAGALLGIATASPEITVHLASIAFGWPDLGLGAALGSNVPALPLIFVIAFLSTRMLARRAGPAPAGSATASEQSSGPASRPEPPRVQAKAVSVQVLPYLLVLLLLAVLTLTPGWEGLQPIDGLLLLGAYAAYFAHAWVRHPRPGAKTMPPGALRRAALGVPGITAGALVSVTAASRLGSELGLPDLATGLFVIGLLCALPESFAAWRLARQNRTTIAVSTAMGDGIVSLTVALFVPALVTTAIGNQDLYAINIVFLAATLLAYIGLNHRRRGQELGLGFVGVFAAGYLAYLATSILVLAT